MPYDNPTPHELRMAAALPTSIGEVHDLIENKTGGEIDFFLVVTSSEARAEQAQTHQTPVGMYGGTVCKTSAALMMMELLFKWRSTGEIGKLDQIQDAEGNTIHDMIQMIAKSAAASQGVKH